MDFTLALIGSTGLDVTDSYIETIHTLVVALVSKVTTILKGLLTIFGVRPWLDSVLRSVFQILAKVLILLMALLGAIVPSCRGPQPAYRWHQQRSPSSLLTLAAGRLAGLTA
ncbi:hypothetical protein BKA56DRAFT_678298 [Ilyonectria sp. MPI-CAGE-AT-0026]|nr:hypothetical protein BKA56DRAFT_678298 [Ilyonectria sp. MPI-CAGE-AT-0026]